MDRGAKAGTPRQIGEALRVRLSLEYQPFVTNVGPNYKMDEPGTLPYPSKKVQHLTKG